MNGARRIAVVAWAIALGGACARGGLSTVEGAATPAAATSVETARACAACAIDPTRYLRQLSLDLRGAPPSIEELEAVAREGTVSDARIDAMLRSDALVAQVKKWHAALLWPSTEGFRMAPAPIIAVDPTPNAIGVIGAAHLAPEVALVGPEAQKHPDAVIIGYGGGENRATFRGRGRGLCDPHLEYPPPAERGPQPTYGVVGSDGKRRTYPYYDDRGVPLFYHDAAHCPNYCSSKSDPAAQATAPSAAFASMDAPGADPHPHELDPRGKHCPATHPYRLVNRCENVIDDVPFAQRDVRVRRDGFRWMTHYWSRGKKVKTCAYEAQTRVVSAYTGQSCASFPSEDLSCGCGPDGAFCASSATDGAIHAALDEEPLAIVASVVARDEDYFDAFTTTRSFANGPLAFYFRAQTDSSQAVAVGAPAPAAQLPEIPWEDPAWHEYVRGPEHAGVLTTIAYLLRFPTWRARVSQFRTSFMCRPFTPATASFPGPDDPCTREPNLAKRCGCRNCHVAIEPMTAWFARWSERGAKYLSPAEYPAFNPECRACAITHSCPPQCVPYAIDVADAEGERFAGTLRGYLYRTPDEQRRIEEGPRGLVESAIATGELESCTVRTAWTRLLGRPMTDDEMRDRLPALEAAFEEHHRSYRELLRAIVTSPEYRRLE